MKNFSEINRALAAKKKIFTLFVAALCCVAMQAETIYGDCGTNMEWEFNTGSGALYLIGTGPMDDFSDENSVPWFQYKSQIKSIQKDSRSKYTSIGEDAFTSCTALESVDLPNTVTTIGKGAFSNCQNMTSCNLPSSLTEIGNVAFSWCKNLAGDIVFPAGLTTIGNQAFANCPKITSFSIPATATTIGDNAFLYCTGITYFSVNSGNPNYTVSDNALFNKNKTTLIQYPAAHSRTSYTVPQSVTEIEDGAFSNATNLTELILPDQLETIGSDGLADCSALTEITLPASLQSLGNWAMSGCTALTKIVTLATTPPTATSYTFNDVPKTIPVYIPAGTLAAYKSATGWSAFTNLIGSWQCGDNLYAMLSADGKTLTIEGTGDMWDYSYENPAPWSKEKENITAISLPDGLTSIGNRAFYYCYKVPAITLPSTLQRIGTWGFYQCQALTTIDIPAGVTLIGEDAFVGCDAMTAYTVAATNSAYCAENGVLFTKDKKILIQYPAAKTGNAYEVPYGVEQLVLRAIVNKNLRSVTLPATLQTMGEFALSSSNILQIKTHASFPPIARNNTFSSIDYSLPLYVPVGTKAFYEAATGWLFFSNIIEDPSLDIDQITNDELRMTNKVIRDGVLLIERNGKTYNAQGAEVK